MSGAVLGIGDKVCKSNDELKLERDESSDFYVLMTCHSRDLWSQAAIAFGKFTFSCFPTGKPKLQNLT